ncbi:MAG TPA: response regulator [Planctomycetaceae bacterium]
MNENIYPILLVEDSPEDTEATIRAFKKAGVPQPIFHCENGDEGLDFLYRRGKYIESSQAPRPSVILLDLNLPGTDGREVLAEIKKDERLRTIPVLVLTTSTDERDIEKCYQMGANSYIKKPVDFDSFLRAVERLVDYWLRFVVLPRGE